ncbi:DegV family protein [Streptococcus hongkongensis]|nr:DegV domain protein [Streptococcus uberis]
MTFTILTDSTSDLNQDWVAAHQIAILGLTVELNDQTYQTVGQDALDSNQLLEEMKKGAKPKTSQINVGTFEAYFREKAKLKEPVLYVAFSSVLSGTYQSAVMARDMILEDYPEAVIEIIDTLAAAGGEALLVLKAVEARKSGTSLQETKAMIEALAPRITSYFLVDDLYHLMRGGRLSKSSAILGSLASIKPILSIGAEGALMPISKVRGRKKAIRELLTLSLAEVANEPLVISYTGDSQQAEELKAIILEEGSVSEVLLMPIGPVIAAHVGPDTLAIFSIGQFER